MTSFRIPAVLAAAALALPAFAQTTSTERIDKRQANQEQRIEQGEKSGSLTKNEAAHLEKGEQHIQNMENKATADGKVSAKEQERINKAQNKESRKIARQKHDAQAATGK